MFHSAYHTPPTNFGHGPSPLVPSYPVLPSVPYGAPASFYSPPNTMLGWLPPPMILSSPPSGMYVRNHVLSPLSNLIRRPNTYANASEPVITAARHWPIVAPTIHMSPAQRVLLKESVIELEGHTDLDDHRLVFVFFRLRSAEPNRLTPENKQDLAITMNVPTLPQDFRFVSMPNVSGLWIGACATFQYHGHRYTLSKNWFRDKQLLYLAGQSELLLPVDAFFAFYEKHKPPQLHTMPSGVHAANIPTGILSVSTATKPTSLESQKTTVVSAHSGPRHSHDSNDRTTPFTVDVPGVSNSWASENSWSNNVDTPVKPYRWWPFNPTHQAPWEIIKSGSSFGFETEVKWNTLPKALQGSVAKHLHVTVDRLNFVYYANPELPNMWYASLKPSSDDSLHNSTKASSPLSSAEKLLQPFNGYRAYTSIPVIHENGTPYRAYNANITDELAWRFDNSYLAPIPHFEKFREVFIYTRRSFTQLPEDIKISIARSLGISAFQLIFTQDEHDALRWHVVEEESQWTM